jgi:hypothetical protein
MQGFLFSAPVAGEGIRELLNVDAVNVLSIAS